MTQDVDYFVLADDPSLSVPGWTTVLVENVMGDSGLGNRYYKIIGVDFIQQYDLSIYVDGNIRIIGDLTPLIDDFTKSQADLGLFAHPVRCTVAEEIQACLALGKVSSDEVILTEYNLLRAIGFLDESGLTENNVIIRSIGSESLDKAMRYWWSWVSMHSGRDQITLPYVRQKFQLSEKIYYYNARTRNPFFGWYPHRRSGHLKHLYAHLGARQFEGTWDQWLFNAAVSGIGQLKQIRKSLDTFIRMLRS